MASSPDTHIGSLKTGLGVASIIMAPLWLGLATFTMGSLLGGGLWIGHEASLEASRVAQENFMAAPRRITMAEVR